jgi:hypothetical protein
MQFQRIAKNLLNGLWEWQETLSPLKAEKGPIALESHLGSSSRRPLASEGLDPLLREDFSTTRLRSSQEEKGPIAHESHLGSSPRRPLASEGLDPLLQPDYDENPSDRMIIKRAKYKRRKPVEEVDPLIRFKFINDEGTARLIFASCGQHEYVEMIYQDIIDLNIPEECLQLAEGRYHGRGAQAQYTEVVGSKLSAAWHFTNIPVLHQSASGYCLAFGIFNILSVPLFENTRTKFISKLKCSHCGMTELTQVAKSFGIHLIKIKDDPASRSIEWLLSRNSGLYLITKDVHCISVDVDRKLIFDCGYAFALNFHKESLLQCGFSSIDKIRLIVLPKYLMPSNQ